MKKYDKLVRDKIPEYIRKKGGKPVWHTASAAEYKRKLREKLVEEAQEVIVAKTKTELLEELADVAEVFDALCRHAGITAERLAWTRLNKCLDRGAFEKRIILDKS